MFECRCGSCQKPIPREDSKRIVGESVLSCPYCMTPLVFGDSIRLMANILGAVLVIAVIYFTSNWHLGAVMLLLTVVQLLVGKEIDTAFLCYGISLLFSLPLAKQT